VDRSRLNVRVGGRVARLPIVLWLTLIWVLLWDRITLANAIYGFLLGLALLLAFPFPAVDPGMRLRPLGLVRFGARFALDLARSVLPLAWQAVGSNRPGRANSVIAVTLRTRSDAVFVLTAVALSAVPGTLVLDMRRATGTLFLHALGVSDDATADLARRQVLDLEARVVRAIGTRADLRALSGEGNP
jgi:multicomponent Na+:H+ antiporter subunit E